MIWKMCTAGEVTRRLVNGCWVRGWYKDAPLDRRLRGAVCETRSIREPGTGEQVSRL